MCSKSAMHVFLHLQSGMCWECPHAWLLKSNPEEFPDTFHLEDGEKRALHFLNTFQEKELFSSFSLCLLLSPSSSLLFFSCTLLNYSFLLHSLTPYLSSPLIYSSFPLFSSHLFPNLLLFSPALLSSSFSFSPHQYVFLLNSQSTSLHSSFLI